MISAGRRLFPAVNAQCNVATMGASRGIILNSMKSVSASASAT